MLPAGAEDYERRLINFTWAPGNRHPYNQRLALAAPCASGILVSAAKAVAKRAADKNETFPDVTLWVAAAKGDFDQVTEVLAPTGIKTIWIDPERSIPQRADRFPDNDERLQELKAYELRLLADISAEQTVD
jgi:hypothetical protein